MIFNDGQTRHLLATFKYMDKGLGNALRAASGDADGQVLCPEHLADATTAQRAALTTQVARFRSVLRQFLERQQITVGPATRAIVAFETALEFVHISLDEIGPRGLAKFGELSPEGAAEVTRLIADLDDIVGEMMMICRELIAPAPGAAPVAS